MTKRGETWCNHDKPHVTSRGASKFSQKTSASREDETGKAVGLDMYVRISVASDAGYLAMVTSWRKGKDARSLLFILISAEDVRDGGVGAGARLAVLQL